MAPRKWELIERDKPVAESGSVLIRIERAAICGTDKQFYCGTEPPYPHEPGLPGHEAIGTVEFCPSGRYEPGERVLVWGYGLGMFQEYVVAPDERHLRLPKGPEPEVILMSQLLGTVVHCLYKLDNVINKSVVVLGQGPVGQLFNACFRNLGARHIIGVDPLRYRLDIGTEMGATHSVDPGERSVAEAVAEITTGELADIVVEAVGKEETFNQAITLLRRNGTIVYFGVPDKDNSEGLIQLRFGEMFRKELRLVTSVGPSPDKDLAVALQWIAEGRIDVRPILTHVLPLEEIQAGFEMAFDKPEQQRPVKIVLAL